MDIVRLHSTRGLSGLVALQAMYRRQSICLVHQYTSRGGLGYAHRNENTDMLLGLSKFIGVLNVYFQKKIKSINDFML